jgi:hypothetical protein
MGQDADVSDQQPTPVVMGPGVRRDDELKYLTAE